MWALRSKSFTPSEEFERLRVKIESRRLRRKRRNHKIKVKAEEYATSAALHPGDEITRRINLASWHHGIYMGGGKVCDRNTDTSPNMITLEHFLEGNDEFEVLLYKRDSDEARADTLAIAMMATQEQYWTEAPYDVLGNNCEHFTNFCRVGHKYSRQAAAFAGGFAAAVAIGAGTGVIGTGVLLYGAYQGANHVCRQMVSKVDDDDGEDSECESSDSEKDESTSTDRKNEVTNETWSENRTRLSINGETLATKPQEQEEVQLQDGAAATIACSTSCHKHSTDEDTRDTVQDNVDSVVERTTLS